MVKSVTIEYKVLSGGIKVKYKVIGFDLKQNPIFVDTRTNTILSKTEIQPSFNKSRYKLVEKAYYKKKEKSERIIN